MTHSTTTNLGLLLLRLGVGGALAVHGSQKLFGKFGGGGIEGTGAFMDSLGFRPGEISAVAAGLGEFGGGTALALGIMTPVAGSAAAATMAVAATVSSQNGFFAAKGGLEYPAILGVASAALALTGAGKCSVDGLFRGKLTPSWMGPLALTASLGAAGALIAHARQTLADEKSASGSEGEGTQN